jgi:hypothetical protein
VAFLFLLGQRPYLRKSDFRTRQRGHYPRNPASAGVSSLRFEYAQRIFNAFENFYNAQELSCARVVSVVGYNLVVGVELNHAFAHRAKTELVPVGALEN